MSLDVRILEEGKFGSLQPVEYVVCLLENLFCYDHIGPFSAQFVHIFLRNGKPQNAFVSGENIVRQR